ncbi:hypothetical protein MP228_009110 [Amoeboaphelidium protococcarum]|nr:hypothetical protein MP228_009110 [Amoeboaphelidium protococcarum]
MLKCCNPNKMLWRLIGMLDQMVSSCTDTSQLLPLLMLCLSTRCLEDIVMTFACTTRIALLMKLQYSSILATTRYEFQIPTLLQYNAYATSLNMKLPPKFWKFDMYISVTQGDFQVPADIADNIKKHVIELIYKSGVKAYGDIKFAGYRCPAEYNERQKNACVKLGQSLMKGSSLTSGGRLYEIKVLEKADPDASLRSYCGQMALIRRVYWNSFKVQDGKVALN